MDFHNFEEYISAYLDDELSIDEKKEFESIMSSHSECKMKFEEVKSLIGNLNQSPQFKTTDDFMENLQVRIDKIDKKKITILDRISSFLTLWQIKPAYGVGVSFAAILIMFIALNEGGFNSTDTTAKTPLKLEKYSSEEIAYKEMDEEQDTSDMKSNVSINLVRGEESLSDGDE